MGGDGLRVTYAMMPNPADMLVPIAAAGRGNDPASLSFSSAMSTPFFQSCPFR